MTIENIAIDPACAVPSWLRERLALSVPKEFVERLRRVTLRYGDETLGCVETSEGARATARIAHLPLPGATHKALCLVDTLVEGEQSEDKWSIDNFETLSLYLLMGPAHEGALQSAVTDDLKKTAHGLHELRPDGRLHGLMSANPKGVVFLRGPGGVSKSTLTRQWFDRIPGAFVVDVRQLLDCFRRETVTGLPGPKTVVDGLLIDGLEHLGDQGHPLMQPLRELVAKINGKGRPVVVTSREAVIFNGLISGGVDPTMIEMIEVTRGDFYEGSLPPGFRHEERPLKYADALLADRTEAEQRVLCGAALLDLGDPKLTARILSVTESQVSRWLNLQEEVERVRPSTTAEGSSEVRWYRLCDSARDAIQRWFWVNHPLRAECWTFFALPYLETYIQSVEDPQLRSALLSRGVWLLLRLLGPLERQRQAERIGSRECFLGAAFSDILVKLHDLLDVYYDDWRPERGEDPALDLLQSVVERWREEDLFGPHDDALLHYLSDRWDFHRRIQQRSKEDTSALPSPGSPPEGDIALAVWLQLATCWVTMVDRAHGAVSNAPGFRETVADVGSHIQGLIERRVELHGSLLEPMGMAAAAMMLFENNRTRDYNAANRWAEAARTCLGQTGNRTRMGHTLVACATNLRIRLRIEKAQRVFSESRDDVGHIPGARNLAMAWRQIYNIERAPILQSPQTGDIQPLLQLLLNRRAAMARLKEHLKPTLENSHQLVGRGMADNLLRYAYQQGWTALLSDSFEDMQHGLEFILSQPVLMALYAELSESQPTLISPPLSSRYGNAAIGFSEAVEAIAPVLLPFCLGPRCSTNDRPYYLKALRTAVRQAQVTLVDGVGRFALQKGQRKPYEANVSISFKNLGALLAWDCRLSYELELLDSGPTRTPSEATRALAWISRMAYAVGFNWMIDGPSWAPSWCRTLTLPDKNRDGFDPRELLANIEQRWSRDMDSTSTQSLLPPQRSLLHQLAKADDGLTQTIARLRWIIKSTTEADFALIFGEDGNTWPNPDYKKRLSTVRMQSFLHAELFTLPKALRLPKKVYLDGLDRVEWKAGRVAHGSIFRLVLDNPECMDALLDFWQRLYGMERLNAGRQSY